MSTFEGRMKEYRLVSLDRFDGENLRSTVYFLSHMHSDHTVGLDQGAFFSRLKQRGNSFLYCSEITKLLLLGNEVKYGRLAPYVKCLDTLCPTTIQIPAACDDDENSTVLVTLLPADHCLGSVMFLFEGDEGNVLYTGDFRWGLSDAVKMPYLDPSAKPLRSIYVDTTFCCPKSFYIPSREQCEEGVLSLVDSYFQEYGTNGYIWVESRTSFGHEILLKEISLRAKMKIHVVHWKKVLYDQVPGLEDIFTDNAEETRIHAHPKDKYKRLAKNALPCGFVLPNNQSKLIQIKPSTMWFTTLPEIVNVVQKHGEDRFRACYSFHSSYAEIRDLVQYLKPARVFPSVIPTIKTFDQIQTTLNSFLLTPHYKHFSSLESEEQPLGIMKISKNYFKDSNSIEDCAFDESEKSQNSELTNSQGESSGVNSQNSFYKGSQGSGSELDLYSDEEGSNVSTQTPEKRESVTESSLPTHVEDNSDDSDEEDYACNSVCSEPWTASFRPEDDTKERVETSLEFSGNTLQSGTSMKQQEKGFDYKNSSQKSITEDSETRPSLSEPFEESSCVSDEYGNDASKIEFSGSQPVSEDGKTKSVERSPKFSGSTLQEEHDWGDQIERSPKRACTIEAIDKTESGRDRVLSEGGDILSVGDISKTHGSKVETNINEKSTNKINLESLFGSEKSFLKQLNSSDASSRICLDQNTSVPIENQSASKLNPERQCLDHSNKPKPSSSVDLNSGDQTMSELNPERQCLDDLNKLKPLGGDDLSPRSTRDQTMLNLNPGPKRQCLDDLNKPKPSSGGELSSRDQTILNLNPGRQCFDDLNKIKPSGGDDLSSRNTTDQTMLNLNPGRQYLDDLNKPKPSGGVDLSSRSTRDQTMLNLNPDPERQCLNKPKPSGGDDLSSGDQTMLNQNPDPEKQCLEELNKLKPSGGGELSSRSSGDETVLNQISDDLESDVHKSNPANLVGKVNSSTKDLFVGEAISLWEKASSAGDHKKETDLEEDKAENVEMSTKFLELAGRRLVYAKRKNDDENVGCSLEKYSKTDMNLKETKWQGHEGATETVKPMKEEEEKRMVLQTEAGVGVASESMEEGPSTDKGILPDDVLKRLDSNNYRSAVSPYKNTVNISCQSIGPACTKLTSDKEKNIQNFDLKHEEKKCFALFNYKDSSRDALLSTGGKSKNYQKEIKMSSSKVLPQNSSLDISSLSTDIVKLKESTNASGRRLSQDSSKTDVSIEFLEEISENPAKLVEISDSDEEDCIAIDSDSDRTLPPSPKPFESSQELFSSPEATKDLSSNASDNDVVVLLETSGTSHQNTDKELFKKSHKRTNSIINLD